MWKFPNDTGIRMDEIESLGRFLPNLSQFFYVGDKNKLFLFWHLLGHQVSRVSGGTDESAFNWFRDLTFGYKKNGNGVMT